MRRNPLIVLEGIDGAGKATQVKLLSARLKKEGRAASVFSFPRYGTPVGNIIRESLQGKHGDFRNLDAYLTSIPYALDRAVALPQLQQALKKGPVICDRYTTSALAFGAAKCKPSERAKFQKFFEDLEYKQLGVPKPDLVLYLSLPTTAAQRLLSKEGKKKDQNERDRAFQKEVARLYEQLAKRPGWKRVPCVEKGRLLSPREIHERIWREVSKKLR
ncbi:MAG: dTMP kinase [Candidatus Kaiserbacteria bacterium]|nr:dTMP kinase [Candidatus Kaiserbacteria bacterium]